MRSIIRSGVLGCLPGVVVMAVPVLLHEIGLISADQSQIGFLGLPVLLVGAVVGTARAATDVGCGDVALPGVVAGLLVGVIVGGLLGASGVGVPGLPIIVVPGAVIAVVALAAHLRLRNAEPNESR